MLADNFSLVHPSADSLAKELGGKRSGTGYQAHCPAHQDEHSSLSITDNDGKLLVHCHAGCSQNAVVTALKQCNLWPSKKMSTNKSRIVVTYDYVDEDGKLLYQVVRCEPKDFWQRRPDGAGGWIWNLDGVERVLYNLPKVQWATISGDSVFVVEGERDCENLSVWRLIATTNCGGAGKWLSQYTTSLKDITQAFILPDNDTQGHNHGQLVAKSLHEAGIPVKVVLLPNLPPKGDVSDWITDGGTKEKLIELCEQAPAWKPPIVEVAEQTVIVPAWPRLSPKALYGLSGEVVDVVCKNSEADPAAVLVTFLVSAGARLGSGVYVNVGATRHPPRLFSAIVGASAKARKGTSADPIRLLVEQAHSPGMPVLKISNGPLSSGEGLIFAVRDASEKLNKNGTLEDEGVQDKRLLVIESELSSAFKVMQREGNTLSPILRGFWDNGNNSPLTKHNRISTTNAHVCIVGHITEQELRTLLRTSDVWNGFANRFLWVCARRQKLVARPAPLHDSIIIALAGELSKATDTASMSGEIVLSSNASRIWDKLYPILSADEPGAFGAVTARGEAQTLRIALTHARLAKSREILPEHLEAALGLWEYCKDSARYIFGHAEIDPDANKVLRALSEGDKTQTELNRLFSGHMSSDRLKAILTELQASGRLSQRPGGNGKGKASTIWSLTEGFPTTYADFAEIAE